MLLVLQIAQYEAVALEVKKLPLVLFWTVFRIMPPGGVKTCFLFCSEQVQEITLFIIICKWTGVAIKWPPMDEMT